jgi:hypothetical protein
MERSTLAYSGCEETLMWDSTVGGIVMLLLSLLAAPLAAEGQPPGQVYRISYLGTGSRRGWGCRAGTRWLLKETDTARSAAA